MAPAGGNDMAESKPPDSDPPEPPLRLGYAAPNWWERPAGNVPYIAQVAIGFGAFVTAWVVAGALVWVGPGNAADLLMAPVIVLVSTDIRWRQSPTAGGAGQDSSLGYWSAWA